MSGQQARCSSGITTLANPEQEDSSSGDGLLLKGDLDVLAAIDEMQVASPLPFEPASPQPFFGQPFDDINLPDLIRTFALFEPEEPTEPEKSAFDQPPMNELSTTTNNIPGQPTSVVQTDYPGYNPQPPWNNQPPQFQTPSDVRVEIQEQPQNRNVRFRYVCEGRSAGSILGSSSSVDRKTFPTIKIHNYTGAAAIVVSCVTDGSPPRPHPHSVVGKDCSKSVCTVRVKDASLPVVFQNLGIQCVKRNDIKQALKERQEIQVNPFQTVWSDANINFNMKAVRLCFQVFLDGATVGKPNMKFVPVDPVVSQTIYDRNANTDMKIYRLSSVSCTAHGGADVILLCEKVDKGDVEVIFYEMQQGKIIWEDKGDFQPSDVHKGCAIPFRTPPYQDETITEPVTVQIQLRSKKTRSDPVDFQYYPIEHDQVYLVNKRRKAAEKNFDTFKHRSQASPSGVPVDERVKKLAERKISVKSEKSSPLSPEYSSQGTPSPVLYAMPACATSHVTYNSTHQNNVPAEMPPNVQMASNVSAAYMPPNVLLDQAVTELDIAMSEASSVQSIGLAGQ